MTRGKLLTLLAGLTAMAALLLGLAGCGSASESESADADMVITGTIYTEDADDTVAEAVAIKDGKIVYVGDAAGVAEYQGDATEVIETGEGVAIPGMIDAHAHGNEGGVGNLFEVNMMFGESYQDYLDAVQEFVDDPSHDDLEYIIGNGWINGYVPSEGPKAADLDKIEPNRPIVIASGDHHSYWVNSKFLEVAGIDKDTADVDGGVITRDEDGNPLGCFRDKATDLVDQNVPDYTVEQYKEGILNFQNEMKGYGMTAYYEPMVNLNGSENLLQAYKELEENGEMVIKCYGGYQIVADQDIDEQIQTALALREETKDNANFKVVSVKLLTDGVVEGHTAALSEPYADDPDYYGELLFTDDQLLQIATGLNKEGMTVHAHCIGDAATTQVLDAFEAANEELGNSAEVRNAITHLQVVNKKDFQRMADLNVIAVTNPYWFLKEPGYYEELEVPFLGKKRASHEYPMKDFFDAGVMVTTASDYPVTQPNAPLAAVQAAVTRMDMEGNKDTLQNPDQIVTVEQMMKTITYNPAYQNFDEENTGSLEVGKEADIAVLGADPYKVEKTAIHDIAIRKTINDGQTIYDGEAADAE